MASAKHADDVLTMVQSTYATVGEGDLIRQDFKEKVERIEGPVSSTEVMTDIAGAAKKLTEKRGKETVYTVVQGDNPGKVARKQGVTTSELFALNPGLEARQTRMKIGEKLKISRPKAGITVITVKREQRKVEIDPGPRQEQQTPNLRQGQRSVTRKAEKGLATVTVDVTYENERKLPEEKVVKETRTKEPVRELVLVGTGPQ